MELVRAVENGTTGLVGWGLCRSWVDATSPRGIKRNNWTWGWDYVAVTLVSGHCSYYTFTVRSSLHYTFDTTILLVESLLQIASTVCSCVLKKTSASCHPQCFVFLTLVVRSCATERRDSTSCSPSSSRTSVKPFLSLSLGLPGHLW